jgi:hypothetical protein
MEPAMNLRLNPVGSPLLSLPAFWLRLVGAFALLVILPGGPVLSARAQAQTATWTVTPSFHTLSLYYGYFPTGTDTVAVQYRQAGSPIWKNAQNLSLDRTAPSALTRFRNQYRGSIVNLSPATVYELQFRKGAGAWTAMPPVRTRSEIFAGTTIAFSGVRTSKLVISAGGTADNWRIYDGQSSTIDPNHGDNCVEINASYVVLRNFIITDCKFQAIVTTRPHVVITDNDIYDWGEREFYYPSKGKAFTGSKSLSASASRCIAGTDKASLSRADDAAILVSGDRQDIVIQNNRIHDPRYRSSRWNECSSNSHPWGSRAITAIASKQLTIRYNTIYARNDRVNGASGLDRGTNRYYDAIYVSSSQDVDIYGNVIRNATDDLIEADNYAVNMRIFGNYFDSGLSAISHQAMQAGPAYVFRNVFDRGAAADGADYVGISPKFWAASSDRALKMALDNGNAATAMFSGPLYLYHNTMLRTDPSGFKVAWGIASGNANKWRSPLYNIFSVNNIFMTYGYYIRDQQARSDFQNHYFADLHNKANESKPLVNYALSGTCATGGNCVTTAAWQPGHGPVAGSSAAWPPTGLYQIANPDRAGMPLVNFNGTGNRDRGAHGNVARMTFGPGASWTSGTID